MNIAIMGHGVFPCQQAAAQGKFSFPVLFYLIVFAVIMVLGWVLDLKNKNKVETTYDNNIQQDVVPVSESNTDVDLEETEDLTQIKKSENNQEDKIRKKRAKSRE